MQSDDGVLRNVIYRFEPAAPAMHRLMSFYVRLGITSELSTSATLSLDATMPAHGHGMNYAPPEVQLRDNQAKIDGLLFHMPGHWRVRFTIRYFDSDNDSGSASNRNSASRAFADITLTP